MTTPSTSNTLTADQIRELAQQFITAQATLEAALNGQVDAIFDPGTTSSLLLKHAQEALRQSDDRYQRLVSRIAAIIFELTADGFILFVNDSISTLTGYMPPELQARNLWTIFCPGTLHDQVDVLNAQFESGDVTNFELTISSKGGQPLVLNLNSANVYRADGGLERIVGLAIDITAQKRIEQEREQLLEQIRQESQRAQQMALDAKRAAAELDGIFNAMNNPVVMYNAEGIVVRANPAAREVFGANPDGLSREKVAPTAALRRPDGQAVADADLPRNRALRQGLVTTGTPFTFISRSGEEHAVLVSAAPLFEGGQISGAVTVWNDITEQMQLTVRLAERERFNRAVLDSLRALIVVIDKTGMIIATNDAWDRHSRENSDSLLSRIGPGQNYLTTVQRLADQGDLDSREIIQGVRGVLSGSEINFSYEFMHTDQGQPAPNAQRWSRLRAMPLSGAEGGVVISHSDTTEQNLAKLALLRSEKHFRSLIERSADGLSLLNGDGIIMSEGPAAFRLWGRSTIGLRFLDNIHRADLEICQTLWANIINQPNMSLEATFRVMHPDRTWRWIEASATNLLHEPSVEAIVVNYRDITTRRQAEEQLKQYATRLEGLHQFDGSILAIKTPDEIAGIALRHIMGLTVCEGANITLIDQATQEVTLFTTLRENSDAVSKREVISFDIIGGMDYWIDQLRQGQPIMIADLRTLPSTPSIESAIAAGRRALYVVPLLLWGEVIGNLNIWAHHVGEFNQQDQDLVREIGSSLALAITRARLFEATNDYNRTLEETVRQRTLEVNRSKDNLETIFNNSGDAIIVIDVNGIIKQKNPAFRQMFGFSTGEAVGKSITELAESDSRQTLAGIIQTVIAEARPVELEIYARRKNGAIIDVDISLSPIISQDGTSTEIVCNLRDITAHKRVERELQELNQIKTEFLSTAAHELRTPLTTIRGFSELLLTRQLDTARQMHFIQLLEQQSTQLGLLLDDLLDISRMEAKRSLALNFEAVDLSELMHEAAELYAEIATDHPIQITESFHCPLIVGDPFRLAQVLKNLLSNAIKYSPHGGAIDISIERSGGFVQVSIRDHGLGLTAEQQTHLFEKFYRADVSNTSISGTGLGLSICKTIVELHGGQIWAHSDFNDGAAFYFTLPLPVTGPV